jgi:hypothetical protein
MFCFSDHLAVKGYVNNISVASWNTLFEKWRLMNIGPKGDGHIGNYFPELAKIDPNRRKLCILLSISDIMSSVDILGLQEFDPAYLDDLRTVLYHDGRFEVVLPKEINGSDAKAEDALLAKGSNDLQIVIYNKRKLRHNDNKSHMTYYIKDGSAKINKRIMNLSFSTPDGIEFRFVNTHVLFGEVDQLVNYVKGIRKPADRKTPFLIIIVGDMNQESRPTDLRGLKGSPDEHFLVCTERNKFTENINYTHRNTDGKLVVYDHIWHMEI